MQIPKASREYGNNAKKEKMEGEAITAVALLRSRDDVMGST